MRPSQLLTHWAVSLHALITTNSPASCILVAATLYYFITTRLRTLEVAFTTPCPVYLTIPQL
jgi:hypothetical protein